jgi:(4S)-4-hydroxy-5-phosphonooxypentane-2,3-dione isomerase
MHIVLVHIQVKPERVAEFIQASLENAKNSIQEPGIARFDFIQQVEDPGQFTLVEVYHSPEDQQKHRETAHYLVWKDKVADMMAEPRVGVRYRNLYPEDRGWE